MIFYQPNALGAAILLFAALSGPAALAQQKAEFFAKVETAFKHHEPAWKIEKTIEHTPGDETIAFRNGNQQAAIDLMIWTSPQQAHAIFDGQVIAFDNVPGKHLHKETVANLGDEKYMWTNGRSEAWPTIMFRKGSVFVSVFAPSVTVARRFAQRVVEQIKEG